MRRLMNEIKKEKEKIERIRKSAEFERLKLSNVNLKSVYVMVKHGTLQVLCKRR